MSDEFEVNEDQHPAGTVVSDRTITTKGVPAHLRVDSGDPALAATTFSDQRETTRRPFQGRRLNLKPIKRTADPRGGSGAPAQHGNVLDGGVPDENRSMITVESVGNSLGNRTLMSDHADAGNTIEGGESSTTIAIRQRSEIVGAHERTAEVVAEKTSEKTFEEKLAALKRRNPESMVQPDANQAIGPRVAPKPKAQ